MKKRNFRLSVVAAALAVITASGCSEKGGETAAEQGTAPAAEPGSTLAAERAIAEIDSAMVQVGLDAEQYLPGRLDQVIRDLEALKAALARNESDAVLDAAPDLLARVRKLPAEVAAAKRATLRRDPAAMRQEWEDLSRSLPLMLAAIEARIAALSQAAQLPSGMTAADLAAARAGASEARKQLRGATAAHAAGNVAQAVELGGQAEREVDKLLGLVGMR